jgi:hypothetical protein
MSIWTTLGTWAKAGIPSSKEVLNAGLQMYSNNLSRQRALADQKALNLYNSPSQQMQRYKEAGLNPNLIYNQQNLGQPVRSTDYVAPQIKESQLDVLGKSNQVKVQTQQLKNLELQNEAIQAQITKTKADALYVASNTKFKDLDVERLRGSLPGLVEGVQLRNDTMKAELANKAADTNNKIAQLPIYSVTKQKLENEVDRLIRTNAFIELNENQKLAVQRAMVKSIQIASDLTTKKIATEDFNQQYLYKQITEPVRKELGSENVDMSWLNTIIGLGGMLLPYGAAKLLPKFK